MERIPAELHLLLQESKFLASQISSATQSMEQDMIKQNLRTNIAKIHQKLTNMAKITETSQASEDQRKLQEFITDFEQLKEKAKSEGIEISECK